MDDEVYLACTCWDEESEALAPLNLKFAGLKVAGTPPRRTLMVLLEPIASSELAGSERARPAAGPPAWFSAEACPFCGEQLRESGTEEPPPIVRTTQCFALKLTLPGWIVIDGAVSLLDAMENLQNSYPDLVIARDVISCKQVHGDEFQAYWNRPGASHIYAI